jgi:hypothetical protein
VADKTNLLPGYGFVQETATKQNLLPGYGFVHETVAAAGTNPKGPLNNPFAGPFGGPI